MQFCAKFCAEFYNFDGRPAVGLIWFKGVELESLALGGVSLLLYTSIIISPQADFFNIFQKYHIDK